MSRSDYGKLGTGLYIREQWPPPPEKAGQATQEKVHPGQVVLSCRTLCFLLLSSIVPAPAVSAKSEATSWGQLKLIWRFPTWKGGRGGGLERLEAAYLPDVELTARQECKSRRYGRIWCVCPYCQSEVLSGSSRN